MRGTTAIVWVEVLRLPSPDGTSGYNYRRNHFGSGFVSLTATCCRTELGFLERFVLGSGFVLAADLFLGSGFVSAAALCWAADSFLGKRVCVRRRLAVFQKHLTR